MINKYFEKTTTVCVCVYPESVSTRLGRVAAFTACQVDQVYPAGYTVIMLFTFHKLSLRRGT